MLLFVLEFIKERVMRKVDRIVLEESKSHRQKKKIVFYAFVNES